MKRRKVKQVVLSVIQVFEVVGIITSLFWLVIFNYNANRFLEGTEICGTNVSGLDRDMAMSVASQNILNSYNMTLIFKDGTEILSSYDLGVMLFGLDNIEPQGVISYITGKAKYKYNLSFDVDRDVLRQTLLKLSEFNEDTKVYSRDAYINYNSDKCVYEVVPEEDGNILELDKVINKIAIAVHVKDTTVDLSDCYLTANIKEKDLVSKVDKLNTMLNSDVTYNIDDMQIKLSKQLINSWINVDNCDLDISKISKYLEGLNKFYTKKNGGAYRDRVIHSLANWSSATESQIENTEQIVNYSIDIGFEAKQLANLIKMGGLIERMPKLIYQSY